MEWQLYAVFVPLSILVVGGFLWVMWRLQKKIDRERRVQFAADYFQQWFQQQPAETPPSAEATPLTPVPITPVSPTPVSPTPVSPEGNTRLPVITLRDLGQRLQTAAHIAVIGDTGSGKTTIGEALIRLLSGDGCVVDPKWHVGKWGGLPSVGIDDDAGYTHIEQGLKAVFKEFLARRVYKRDHPDVLFTHLWLVWDEINDTMEEVKGAGLWLRRLLRVAREYNVHCLFFPQSDRVQALGLEGHGDAKKNVLWIYLGDDARTIVKTFVKQKQMSPDAAMALLQRDRLALVDDKGQYSVIDTTGILSLIDRVSVRLTGWQFPVPSSDDDQQMVVPSVGTAGTPSLGTEQELAELRTAAIRYWIAQGLKDTPIVEKLNMRRADGFALVKQVRASVMTENVLQP